MSRMALSPILPHEETPKEKKPLPRVPPMSMPGIRQQQDRAKEKVEDRIHLLESKIEELLQRLPLPSKQVSQPPVHQQLHLPGQERLGHPSGDDASAALAAHQFQQGPRSVRLKEALAGNGPLNMSRMDQRSISHLMDSTLDEAVRTHTQKSLFVSPALLPTITCDEREEAALLLGESIKAANKKREFKDPEDFNRAILADFPKLFVSQGLNGATALLKYVMFIKDIHVQHGWAAANFYHWRLQTYCADGEHDMVREGHYNQQVKDEMREKYPKKAKSGPNGGGPKGFRGDKFCSYHGHHREHATDDCKALKDDPQKKGSRAPNYVNK